MRVALVSLDQEWENKYENFIRCKSFIQRSKLESADLVIFPEMTLTGFSMSISNTSEDFLKSETINWFKSLATEFCVAILFGVVLSKGDKASNNAVLIDATGQMVAIYSKIHLFSFAGENKVFSQGNEVVAVSMGPVTLGLTICYDLRFPELYGALAKKCNLIVNIANWPANRSSQWKALLKARAIENQVFVVGVNRTGIDGNGLVYEKDSQVYGPNGKLLNPIVSEFELDIFDVDQSAVDKFKQEFSTGQDRRPQLYKLIL